MKREIEFIILVCIAAFIMVLVANAQDTTEPAPTVEIVTNTPAPEVTAVAPVVSEPTVAPVPTEAPVPAAEKTTNLWQLLIGMLLSFIAGGGVTLAGVGAVARYVKQDKAILALIEGLANSQPVERRERVKQFGETLGDVADVIKEVSDGIPAADKPSALEVDSSLYGKSAA